MRIQLQNINLTNSRRSNISGKTKDASSTNAKNISQPSFVDSRNFGNVNFKAWSIVPNLSVLEREQFFERLNTVNYFNDRGEGSKIAAELKALFTQRYNYNTNEFVRYLKSIGRTLVEVNLGNQMLLLNNDELLPDMRILGMNYYLSIPSLTLSADSRFCPTYPFFNEDDYYTSFDANPVFVEHPKYLRVWGEGYVDYTNPEDLRLCKKLRDESSNYFLADMDHYFRILSECRSSGKRLIHDINGIYYKEISKYDLPENLRKFPIYMNLKDGSLHAGDSEAFQITPRLPYIYNENPPLAEIREPKEVHSRPQVPPAEILNREDVPTQTQTPQENPFKLFEIELETDPMEES